MEILFPRFTGFYAENLSSADAIFYGNFSVWHIFIQQFANFSNLFLCKFRRWIEFTLAALICAALSDHVRYILQAARGGGYIMSAHSIGSDITVSSYDLVNQVYRQYGYYPIAGI